MKKKLTFLLVALLASLGMMAHVPRVVQSDDGNVAKIGETGYPTLQSAVDAAYQSMTGDVTIKLIDNIEQNATVKQKEGLNLTIDGSDKTYTVQGYIQINGAGRYQGAETLTITGLKFEGSKNDLTSDASFIFVKGANNNAHNVTITNCSFVSTASDHSVVAVKVPSGAPCFNITISECTGSNLHSFVQFNGTTGATVDGNSVEESKSFVSVSGGGGNYTVSNNTFVSSGEEGGYAVRLKSNSSAELTLDGNDFTADEAIRIGEENSSSGNIYVKSGRYVGKIVYANTGTGKIVISGGRFSAPLGDADNIQFIDAELIENGKTGINGIYPATPETPNGIDDAAKVVATLTDSEGKVANYASLEAAFSAAEDGETVTLLQNCSGNGIQAPQGKFSSQGVTVDFGGFTYTMDGSMVGSTGTQTQAFQLLKGNKITFKNGTIYSEKAKMLVQNYSDLTLEGMTLTLNNSSYTSAYTLSNNNGDVVIDGSTINANEAGGFAFDVCRYSSYPSVKVTVKGESVINGNVEVSASGSDANEGFELMLEEGTINGGIVLAASAKAAMAATPDIALVREYDTFGQAAPADYKWVSEGEGISRLALIEYVAQIGDVKYESLAEAVAAVPTDGTETTITMIGNETITVNLGPTIAANQNVILDLNGMTITQTAPDASVSYLIQNKGTLTIKDSSDTNKDGTGTGKMKSTAEKPSTSYGYATNLISNRGNLTIESGYLESATRYASYVVDNYTNGNAVINGGHLYNYFTSAIRLFCNSTTADNAVTVNGGTVEGYCTIWVQGANNNKNKGSLTINGGHFKTTEKKVVEGTISIVEGNSYIYMDPSNENMSITITDGTFDTNFATWGDGNVSISGGTFNGWVYCEDKEQFISGGLFIEEPDASYAIEGWDFGVYAQDPNYYTLIHAVAQNMLTNKKYDDLQIAINAVESGETIKLLKDITLSENLTWSETDGTFTLQFGEFDIDKGDYNILLNLGTSVNTDMQATELFEASSEENIVEETDNGDDTFTYTVITKASVTFELIDYVAEQTNYEKTETVNALKVTYKREFASDEVNKFRAWFIPFDYTIKEADLENFTFYKLHFVVAQSDGGVVTGNDKIDIYIQEMSAGDKLTGNKPYVIKPKASGKFDFVSENVKLLAVDNNPAKTTTTTSNKYNFYGTYVPYQASAGLEFMALNKSNGISWNASANAKLTPYRWYIKTSVYDDDYTKVIFSFITENENGEPTGVFTPENADGSDEIEGFYSVNGIKLNEPAKGVNIIRFKNGTSKKIFIK